MIKNILRWLFFIPLSICGVIVANFLLLLINRWTIQSYTGLEDRDFLYKLWINALLGYILPIVFQYITFYVVPNKKKVVLKVITIVLITLSVLSTLLTIYYVDYWSTLFSIMAIVGAVTGLNAFSRIKEGKVVDEHDFIQDSMPEVYKEMINDEEISNIKNVKYFFAHKVLFELAMYDNDTFSDFLRISRLEDEKPNPFRVLFARFDPNKIVKLEKDDLFPIVRRIDDKLLTIFKLPIPDMPTEALYSGFIAPDPLYFTLELRQDGKYVLYAKNYTQKRFLCKVDIQPDIDSFVDAISHHLHQSHK